MAVLSSDKVKLIWLEGNAPRYGVFRIGPMNTADTWDSATYFAGTIEVATFITGSSTTIGTVASSSLGVLTFTLAGSTGVSAFLTVRGTGSTSYLV